VVHYADGGCRADKFERDRALLEAAARDAPSDARTRFYLANTYRDLGMWEEAAREYEARAALGGWAEEVYLSHLEAGRCRERLGQGDAAVRAFEAAWAANPRRQEAPHALASAAQRLQHHATCALWAREAVRAGEAPPLSLFVERATYIHGSLDLACICAYYAGLFREGAGACWALIARVQRLPEVERSGLEALLERTRSNLKFYEGKPGRWGRRCREAGAEGKGIKGLVGGDGWALRVKARRVHWAVAGSGALHECSGPWPQPVAGCRHPPCCP
jgi:tetratricopeptide (TPR) repeat protein